MPVETVGVVLFKFLRQICRSVDLLVNDALKSFSVAISVVQCLLNLVSDGSKLFIFLLALGLDFLIELIAHDLLVIVKIKVVVARLGLRDDWQDGLNHGLEAE